MRKRLALMFCLLIVSLMGFVGCKNDPYASMTLSANGLQETNVQQLLIEQTVESGAAAYIYPSIDFTVSIGGVKEFPDIQVRGWEGYLEEPILEYQGNGRTRIISKPLSHNATGKFTLNIATTEGNKSLNVDFNIDLKLNDFKVNKGVLTAVAQENAVVLDDIGGLIKYSPENSTQKDIKYSVVVPQLNGSNQYSIPDRLDENVVYLVEDPELYSEYKYADIVVDPTTGKQSLKVYAYFMDSNNKVALDQDGNPIPAKYPQISHETVGGQPVVSNYITIRAHSVFGEVADRFLDIEVVPGMGDIILQMDTQSKDEDGILVNSNSKGEYDIVLIGNDYAGGVLTSDEMDYYTKRTLQFHIKSIISEGGIDKYLDEYVVTIERNILADDGKAVEIHEIGANMSYFKILSALNSGEYTHTFVVQHKDYPDLFKKEIKVNFHVMAIPSKISINNQSVSAVDEMGVSATIYNTYPRGSYGTKFKVNTNSSFSYFVYMNEEDVTTFGEKLHLRKDGDGTTGVLAYFDQGDGSDGHVTPIGKFATYSNFGKSDSFYLSHSLDAIPDEPLRLYVGIMFSMAHNSYSDTIKQTYFDNTLISFPLNIFFENGIERIDFTQSKYYLNLDNSDYAYAQDEFGEVLDPTSGIKLWDLPVGQTVEKAIKDIQYDEELIKVYDYYDPDIDITSLYIKFADLYNEGSTTLQIETYNGLKKSVMVTTYVPTIYQNNSELDANDKLVMPLAISLDQYSTGYLYHVTGASVTNHQDGMFVLQKIKDDTLENVCEYKSVESLFMIVNAKQYIEFYDYRAIYNENEGKWDVTPINITDKVKVTSSHSHYATYSNGVITSYSNVTRNRQPVTLTITYSAGYESFDEATGQSVYSIHNITHKIYLYIYVPLEGVEVTSSKAVDLYVDSSLGYYSKDLATHTIESTFLPNKPELGAEWNEAKDYEWGVFTEGDGSSDGLSWDPVQLRFEYAANPELGMVDNFVLGDNGEAIVLMPTLDVTKGPYYLKYSDLFEVVPDANACECYVRCRISGSDEDNPSINTLIGWLKTQGISEPQAIENTLKNNIFNNNIEFVINIYINQFNKLQNINSVKISAKYASRISNLTLDVEEDGVYFELREEHNEIKADKESFDIAYSLNNAQAINKNILLAVANLKGDIVGYANAYDESSLPYKISVISSSTGNNGVIRIELNKNSVDYNREELQLYVIPEDNVKSLSADGSYEFYNSTSTLVKSFRIKVADGSAERPFEIRNVVGFKAMLTDVGSGYYYNYIITRSIDLKGHDIDLVSFNEDVNINESSFFMSGRHVYVKNSQQIVTYNALYNLTIKDTVTSSANIGLFGKLSNVVSLDNIYIRNANVEITEKCESSDSIVNVGLLAGSANGITLTNSSFVGNIKIIKEGNATISVGGVAGILDCVEMSGMPGNYENGVVATGNSIDVDIEIVGEEGSSTKIIAGGIAGRAINNTYFKDLQVSSQISSKVGATVGGVVGQTANAKVEDLNVNPRIVANVTSAEDLVIGGVIGTVTGYNYGLTNTIVSFVDLGEDTQYTWKHKANIFVYAPNSNVIVGGLVGVEQTTTNSFRYNYIRSFYSVDIGETYKGNIYVIASNGAVGGLIGQNHSGSGMTYSYFDADIVASSRLSKGLLVGNLTPVYTLSNCYAIGNLYNIELKQDDDNNGYYEESPVVFDTRDLNVKDGIWSIAGVKYLESASSFNSYKPYEYADATIHAEDTYAVVNESVNYFAESGVVYVFAKDDAEGNPLSLKSIVGTEVNSFLASEFGYSIATDSTNIDTYEWLWHQELNTVIVGGSAIAYPVILKEGQAMYDLVPTGITVDINDTRDDFYDISIENGSILQLMMFLQRTSNANDTTYYDMAINSKTAEFSISVSGATVFSDFIDAQILKVNDQLEFLENTNGSVIRIDGNKIYPVAPGVATLTIRSYVAKSVKLQITILVVDGITDYSLMYETQEVDALSVRDANNVFYIDELANCNISVVNKKFGKDYIANEHFGFVMEILDATSEDADGKNGVIKIGNIEYTYNPNIAKNIHVFNAKDFDVKGVSHGSFKFVITPFILLDDINHKDTYTSCVDSNVTQDIDGYNAYLLDEVKTIDMGGEEYSYIPMQKVYSFEILARAKGIENTKTAVEIDASNSVAFRTILETANVSVDIQDESGVNYAYVTILEDILVRINDGKYKASLSLKGVTFKCTITGSGENETYTCSLTQTIEIDYTLINIEFNNISITKTNIDSNSRLNTYKISVGGKVSFDTEYYRAHANAYDLNTVTFDVQFIPESDSFKYADLQVKIVPREITTIFTDFYSRGEGALNNGGTDIAYPEENKTSFIVPGREGLLKITLDEEFNNSSYITLSLNIKYFGYVTFTQMAAVVASLEDSEDILGYSQVAVYNQFQDNNSFGIRLSKQSINYNTEHYFNNTYYVKVLVDKNISESSLDMVVSSYKVDGANKHTKLLETPCSLTIMELPEIRMTLDGEENSILGKGVKKQIEIFKKGLTQDVSYRIEEIVAEGQVQKIVDIDEYIYIVDEDGNNANGLLSVEHLNNGGKYYVCQDVLTPAGTNVSINFNAEETILGIIETSNSKFSFQTVGFEIEDIQLCDSLGEVITINHGQKIPLTAKIKYKDIIVGDRDDIANHEESLNALLGNITIAQYGFAGTKVISLEDSINHTTGELKLYYRVVKDNNITYERMSDGLYNGITLSQKDKTEKGVQYLYYELHGTSISDDTYVRLDVDYYYDNDGKLIVSGDSINVYGYTKDYLVVVEDNSTYDHPVPIEDEDDFRDALTIEGGNFILLNNIELNNWVPTDAVFDTLDGNGYSIKINSFNLSASRGASSANVGIFSTLSENSLVKNVTIDISPLLKSETQVINDIAYMRASNKDSYVYRANIDLGYVTELNFGVLAGVNNGAITNTKVVSTTSGENKYLHVLTTLGNVNGEIIVSNIGGLVGLNEETGTITNSYVGVNISNTDGTNYYLTGVKKASATRNDNSDDELAVNDDKIQIYPFILAGGNNIGGMVCINNGTISNSYNKGMGIYNPYPTVGNSATAGLVTYNNNVVTSSFVEGDTIDKTTLKAQDKQSIIESTGYIGGLVYENNAKIENSYTNVYIQTLSSFLGSFVFVNNAEGSIYNSYSTTINKSSLAIGQFTGVIEDTVQNFGIYENCYYTVDSASGEFANINESAIAVDKEGNPYDQTSSWKGFSFAIGKNSDGIWTIGDYGMPRIVTTLTDTISFRILTGIEEDTEGGGYIYNYEYDTYYLGTLENPLIIDKAENFDKYIIDNAPTTSRVFGFGDSSVRYVRIVNNLDFEQIATAQSHKDTYIYKIVFAGVLDGNGLSLNNLNITTETEALENFGLFAQVGHEQATTPAVIKNISLNVRTYRGISNNNAGILAGTVVNSSIINVDINGNNQPVTGVNTAGALAGIVMSTNDMPITLIDVEIENIRVAASYGSLGEVITARSEDKSQYFFEKFSAYKDGQVGGEYSFESLYSKENGDDSKRTHMENVKSVSYAGGVAGVILANNYSIETGEGVKYDSYRTKTDASTINNIVVKGDVVLSTADNSGGLFGYVGENTHIRNCKFILSDSQLLKAFNNVGGLVGEHHGIIEQCTVAYDESTQSEYDATILSNTRTNGSYNLFDMTEGEPYYVVAIGGIAGLSEDGVIIDSYAKVNVVKPLAYIAGGIVGYAKGYNYLGFVYNTGTVYAQQIIGGIIGLQVNNGNTSSIENHVYMDNVVSLSNWNSTDGAINYRNEITSRLYNNTKFMYKKDTTYYNYYIKMPEIGNAPITHMEASYEEEKDGAIETVIVNPSEILKTYRTSHNQYYIGSVVGKALIRDGDNIVNGDSQLVTNQKQLEVYANNNTMKKLYEDSEGSVSNNVFSSTLGIVTTTGTVESGTRQDSYIASSFTVNNGSDAVINSLSYRVSYVPEFLNKYELKYESDNANEYLDRFTYAQVFTAQEYIQQILGSSYTSEPLNENDINTYACKTTRNILTNGYNNEDRSGADNDNVGAFVIPSSNGAKVWDVEEYLPMFSTSVDSTVSKVTDDDSLEKALKYGVAGQVFRVSSDIKLEISDTGKPIKYATSVKSAFVGVQASTSEEITYVGGNEYPTITITVNSGSDVASIFNLLSGAMLQDLNFVIKIEKGDADFLNSSSEFQDYGLLANTLDGVYINNCKFEIVMSESFCVNADIAKNKVFNANNVGVLFGSVINSNIVDSTFIIKAQNVNIDNEKVMSFGLFAGSIKSSNITNCIFDLSNLDVAVNNGQDCINIGGLAGSVIASKVMSSKVYYSGAQDGYFTLTVNDNLQSNKNIGTLFGYAKQLNMFGIKDENDKVIASTFNLNYNANTAVQYVEEVYIVNASLVVGSAEAVKISNYLVQGNIEIKGTAVNTLNIGSIIGYDNKSSMLGKAGVVGSIASITSDVDSLNLSVGGLVGYTAQAPDLFNNSYFDGALNITNKQLGITQYKEIPNEEGGIGTTLITILHTSKTFVGGLLGYASNRVGVSNSIGAGSISVKLGNPPSTNEPILVGIGGIIGGSNGTATLENFMALSEISFAYDYNETYVSGVIGYNNGLFIGKNGYSYVELPNLLKTKTTSITNGSLSSACNNVFYAQEFIGNDYLNDTCFNTFAMGDLYETISEYSLLYTSFDTSEMSVLKKEKIGNIELIIPKSLSGYITRETTNSGSNKFDVNEVTEGNDIQKYNVIIGDVSFAIADGLEIGEILSGRSTAVGKVVLSFTNTDNVFVGENKGTISNIYLKAGYISGKKDVANKVALTTTNNGLITNCYVFGLNKLPYALAQINNGRIYSSATAVKYVQTGNVSTLYGLVEDNKGYIRDCYSGSFGYTESNNAMTDLYGFAGNNTGIIEYSTYYIPDGMQYDNNDKGYVNTQKQDNKKPTNSYREQLPSALLKRGTIWKDENGHAQIVGFKDVAGSINIRLFVQIDSGEEVDIETLDSKKPVLALQNLIKNAVNGGIKKEYKLTYKFVFYESQKPKYEVVRICKGQDFINYINSLPNGYIPYGTIVLLSNDMSKNGDTHILNVPKAENLNAFSLNENSAIIGINTIPQIDADGNEFIPNITLDLGVYKEGSIASEDYEGECELHHEFINVNNGFITDFSVENVAFIKSGSSTNVFAPILENNGVMNNFTMSNIKVSALLANFVAGLVSVNSGKGYIYGCNIYDGITLTSLEHINYICTTNKGTINSTTITGSITYIGKLRNTTDSV